jgi:hypothetical protein
MTTDYTLPPLPFIAMTHYQETRLESYGQQCAETARAPLLKRIAELERSRDFYKRRCDLLQDWQGWMRDPERTLVCDVLANGQTLPDPQFTRYGHLKESGDA